MLVPMREVRDILQKQERLRGPRCKQAHSQVASNLSFSCETVKFLSSSTVLKNQLRVLGLDGRLKSKKEIEGLNKVDKKIHRKNESYS